MEFLFIKTEKSGRSRFVAEHEGFSIGSGKFEMLIRSPK